MNSLGTALAQICQRFRCIAKRLIKRYRSLRAFTHLPHKLIGLVQSLLVSGCQFLLRYLFLLGRTLRGVPADRWAAFSAAAASCSRALVSAAMAAARSSSLISQRAGTGCFLQIKLRLELFRPNNRLTFEVHHRSAVRQSTLISRRIHLVSHILRQRLLSSFISCT